MALKASWDHSISVPHVILEWQDDVVGSVWCLLWGKSTRGSIDLLIAVKTSGALWLEDVVVGPAQCVTVHWGSANRKIICR